jgi:hypothetical protein
MREPAQGYGLIEQRLLGTAWREWHEKSGCARPRWVPEILTPSLVSCELNEARRLLSS